MPPPDKTRPTLVMKISVPLFQSRLLRAFLLPCALCCLWLAADAAESTRKFDISAGKAEITLRQFADQAGTQFFFSTEKVRGTRTNAVKGELTPGEALDAMLAKTTLVAVQDEKTGAYTIQRAATAAEAEKKSASRPLPDKAPASPIKKANRDAVLELDPFTVTADSDVGWVATNALAGGRTNTPLKLTASAISAMTSEFISDLAITDINDSLQWTLNAEPNIPDINSSSQGSQNINFRGTGGAGNYPSRNYFLFYGVGDAYNTERFEFSRGPNAVLFGDAALGGLATTFTKVPRLAKQMLRAGVRYTYPGGGPGEWRGTVDVNQPIGKNAALRINLLDQNGQSYRDYSNLNHKAATAALLVKLGENTQIRLEGEKGEKIYNLFGTTYSDSVSYWNGTYFYDGTNPLTTGDRKTNGVYLQTTQLNVWMPGVPEAGYSNVQNSYYTDGTGLRILEDPRPGIDNFPGLPSRRFTVAPYDAHADQRYQSAMLSIDHRFSDNLHAQLGYYYYKLDNLVENNVTLRDMEIDVNKFLPNGLPNPKVGVPFTEARPSKLNPINPVRELRALVTYKFELPGFLDLKERLTVIAGARREHYTTVNTFLQQVAGPNQNNNYFASTMQVRYRYYWDEPLKYSMGDTFPSAPGYEFAYLNNNLTDQYKKLNYVQMSSVTTLLGERASLLTGLRADELSQHTQSAVSSATVNHGIAQLGANGVVGDWQDLKSTALSPTIGGVFYLKPWLGVFANYSRNFSQPTQGAPDIDGHDMKGPRGKGYDYGLKFSLRGGQIYATLSRYQSHQTDRIVTLTAERNRLRANWANVGSDDPAQTGVDFRDTENLKAAGYEAEIVANLTNSWRLSAGVAFPESGIVESMPGLRRYFAESEPVWLAALAAGTVNNPNQLNNNLAATHQTLDSAAVGARVLQTPDYRWNFYTSYSVHTGRLKGLSFGGGMNGIGPAKVGTHNPNILFDTTAPTNEQRRIAGLTEIKSKDYYTMAARLAYTFNMYKVRTTMQLNVNNVLDTKDPRWRSTTTYTDRAGVLQEDYNSYIYQNPRTYILSATFNF